MSPDPALSLEATLAAQDWADVSRRMTKYAHVLLGKRSWETAEDLAQQAIVQILDGAHATWDRERHPDILDCLGHLVNGLVSNHRKKQKRRGAHLSLREDDAAHDDETSELPLHDMDKHDRDDANVYTPPTDGVHPSDKRTAEDLLTRIALDEDRNARALEMLSARVERDAVCLALLGRIRAGEGKAADQAAALGITVSEVYVAHKRLLRHVRAVARELAEGGS